MVFFFGQVIDSILICMNNYHIKMLCHYGCIKSLLCELFYITVIIYSIYIFEEFKSVNL